MRKSRLAVTLLVPVLLAGCGTATEDRTLGGAALGAGFGSALGIALGPIGVLPGAAIGAVAGSSVGAFTEPEQVNYGVPVWRQPVIYERFNGEEPPPPNGEPTPSAG